MLWEYLKLWWAERKRHPVSQYYWLFYEDRRLRTGARPGAFRGQLVSLTLAREYVQQSDQGAIVEVTNYGLTGRWWRWDGQDWTEGKTSSVVGLTFGGIE